MRKFVFSYNAVYGKYTSQEIREEVIRFLEENGAMNIQQCLDTTFVFNSTGNITQWFDRIQTNLDGEVNVLFEGFYLLNRVFYNNQNKHEIIKKCNKDLKDFVDEIISDL